MTAPRQSVAEIIPEGCKFNGIFIALGVDKQTAHVGDTLLYSLVVGNAPFPSCRAEQIVCSIITPDGVTHPLVLKRTVLNPGESDSYDAVVSYVIRSQDIKNGIAVGTANLTAFINQNIVNENGSSTKDVNTIIVTPCINITATCQGGSTPTSPITFTGKVKNCGDVKLTGVTVSNLVNGATVLVAGPMDLTPGQEVPFNGAYAGDPCAPTIATLTAQGIDVVSPAKTVASTTSVTCGLTYTPGISLTRTCPAVPPLAGGPFQYTGTIQNTGNITLKDITVLSDHPAGNTVVFTLPQLAPGATADFTGQYNTPADSCSTTDTLVVNAKDICGRQTVTANKTLTCPLSASGQIDLTVSCPSAPATAGGTAILTGTVRNPGTVTLQNVVVVNDAAPGTPVLSLTSLAPGASAPFNAVVSVPANVCTVSANFTVTSADRCGGQGIRDTASATCPVVNNPAIVVTHDCPTQAPATGGSGTFTGTVRNTGNVTLNNVTVTSGNATIYGPATLAPGASAPFTGSFAVPADTCSVTTLVTAVGTDACGNKQVTSTSTKTCPAITTPKIDLTKSCPAGPVPPGGQITYSGTVQNIGNVTLTGVTVSSANAVIFGPRTLKPGESASFTGNGAVPANVCSVTDTWTATGKDQCTSAAVTDSATTTCSVLGAPQIDLTIACPSGNLPSGGTATYSGSVVNKGNVTVTNIVVVNAFSPGTPVFTAPTLLPGAAVSFTFKSPVPTDTCTLTTTATATAADNCAGVAASDTASVTCPVSSSPAIVVSHSCPGAPTIPGAPTSFSGLVSNTGDVTLTNVLVYSKLAGTAPIFGPAILSPGQSLPFNASYIIPGNTTACTYESLVNATGNDRCTGKVIAAENRVTCPVQTSPGILVTLSCPAQAVAQGQVMNYKGRVQNTGSGGLSAVTVYDSLTGGKIVFQKALMNPGEAQDFTVPIVVTEDCCTLSTTIRGTGQDACSKVPVTDTATATCPVLFNPAIAVTKVCPADVLQTGDTATMTGTLSNPGDVTLVNVIVVNNVNGKATQELGPISLAPKQVVNYKFSFVVPPDFCGDNIIVASGNVLCDQKRAVVASASNGCKVQTAPMIIVEKHCPTTPVANGNLFTYSGRVSNVGDVTLTNVTVVNSLPSPNTPVFGPATLAPGASADFSGSYTLKEICCETVDVLTAKGRDRCSGLEVQNTSSAVCEVLHTPKLEISEVCRGGNSFSGLVRNTGDIVITNVTVSGETLLLGPIELAPGETASFFGTGTTANTVVQVVGTATCREIQVSARANCSGPIGDVLAIHELSVDGENVGLSWSATAGRFYRVETKANDLGSTWETLPGEVQAITDTAEKTHIVQEARSRFYRVIQLE